MMTMEKGLSPGYQPISALGLSDEIFNVIATESNAKGIFGRGYTYGGHPVDATVALESIKIYQERNIVAQVQKTAINFQQCLSDLANCSLVDESRGRDLIGALEDSLIMNQEPFGPIAPILEFTDTEAVLTLANKLSFGLAAYAFTSSLETATRMSEDRQAGWVSINDFTPALAEAPFSGRKNSGVGSEGGPEGLEAYIRLKFISQFSA